jgi:sirohydrochlorin ferrochelatase
MKRIVESMLVFLLALPALGGQDQAKDVQKPLSARQQYHALLREVARQQQAIMDDVQKAKGDEQQKQIQGLGKDFAEKFYRLAEDNPKDSVAEEALFWTLQNGAGSPVYQSALDKFTALVAEMPLKDLVRRATTIRGANQSVMEVVLKRAEKDAEDPLAADLLALIATDGDNLPIAAKATARLKLILEKSSKPRVKASAAMGLGRVLSAKAEQLGTPHEVIQVQDEADRSPRMQKNTLPW